MNKRPTNTTATRGSIGKTVPSPFLNGSDRDRTQSALAASASRQTGANFLFRGPVSGSTFSTTAPPNTAKKVQAPKSILNSAQCATPYAALSHGPVPSHGLFSPILPPTAAIARSTGVSSDVLPPCGAVAPASQDPDDALRSTALFVQSGGILGHTRPMFSTLASSKFGVAAMQAAGASTAGLASPGSSRPGFLYLPGGLSSSTENVAQGTEQRLHSGHGNQSAVQSQTPSQWLAAKVREIQAESVKAAQLQMKVQAQNRSSVPANSTRHKHWSEEEDELLKYAVTSESVPGGKHKWGWISRKYFKGNRNSTQCKVRWHHHLQPGVIQNDWQPHEDRLIMELRLKGLAWAEIARQLPGRRGEKVRDRYVNKLDPSLKNTPWTVREDEILFRHHNMLGNKWKQIAEFLPGRSQNSIKNRYYNRRNQYQRRLARGQIGAEENARLAAQNDRIVSQRLVNPLGLVQRSSESEARTCDSKEQSSHVTF